jgi:2-keto-4-pentenoate hydratase
MNDTLDTVASLLQARRAGRLQPSATPPLASAEQAYAAQAQVAQAMGWFGTAAPLHWKSGGPSREAVATHAPLPPAGVWASPADARRWPFNLRCVEAEVALRLRSPVDPATARGLDLAGARALVDAMCVSIEMVDSRWAEGLQAPALAKLADLQSHGALVLGDWLPFDAARDWSAQVCRVRVGTQAPQVFRGTHSMADPAFVLLAWLRHATREGATLAAGTVVTTGTWCGIVQAQAGDEVEVAFDGIGAARIQL